MNLKEEAQNDKCCYCEKLLDGYDVEHFRPQRTVKQAHGAGIQRPGYYWLVYAWDNLFLSCHECNSKKGYLFPLEDDTMRVRSHHNNVDIKNEQPLFINPATEEPRKHIRFRGAAVIPHKIRGRVSTRGRATIKGLKLERLDDIRGTRLSLLKHQRNIIELGTKCPNDERWQTLVKGAQEILNNAIRPKAEFSSMARDFLEGE